VTDTGKHTAEFSNFKLLLWRARIRILSESESDFPPVVVLSLHCRVYRVAGDKLELNVPPSGGWFFHCFAVFSKSC
jgi:hypothetical protein